jgi:LuxR family maltose regulon positive regulatory protein
VLSDINSRPKEEEQATRSPTSILDDPWLPMPSIPRGYVRRARLVAKLNRGCSASLTLIAAGPGSGKTVLLSDWARSQSTPVAWVTLVPADNEPRRFWGQLFAAAYCVGGVVNDLTAMWPGGQNPGLNTPTGGRPSGSAEPLTIVLDDAQLLTNSTVLDGLDRLIRSAVGRVRLVLSAQSDPLLPLHRYRMAGSMSELRAADLAMTVEETEQLLRAHGVVLPQADLELLIARTEGWAGGLSLTALRMEGTEHPSEFVARFALDEGSIGEYLVREVLDKQPEPVRRLLVETSFLPEVTAELAQAITGLPDSPEILLELVRTNSFVTACDFGMTRFRYHQLLREVLQHLPGHLRRDQRQAIFARTADWFEKRGDLPNALDWAIQAEDYARVSSIFASGGLAQCFARDRTVCHPRLLEQLGRARSSLGQGPADAATEVVTQASIAAATADTRTAQRYLAARSVNGSKRTRLDPSQEGALTLARLIVSQKAGDLIGAVQAARSLLDDETDSAVVKTVPGLRAAVRLVQLGADCWLGRSDAVEERLIAVVADATDESNRANHVEALSDLTLLYAESARFAHAKDARLRARDILRQTPGLKPPAALHLATARQALMQADLPSAARDLNQALAAGDADSQPAFSGYAAILGAELLIAQGQLTKARVLLDSTPALGSHAFGLLAAGRDAAVATIETSLGRPTAALAVAHRHERTDYAPFVAVAAARAQLALGNLAAGHDQVHSLLAATSPFVTRYRLVQAVLCGAEISLADGDEAESLELLSRAGDIADGDFLLPFVEVTSHFAGLFRRHPLAAAQWPVSSVLSHSEAGIEPDPALRLPEQLTDRERSVIRLLATTMSTSDIAASLFLSINTVKSHMAGIYRKLSVSRRKDAVSRAREYELL